MLKWHRRNAIKSFFFRIPFVMYVWNGEYKQTVFVHTIKKIKKGEELCVNYNAQPNDKTKVWFNAK